MKIFVVSLKRAIERREAIVLQLERLKVDFELIDAVDGKLIKESEKKKLVDIQHVGSAMAYIVTKEAAKNLLQVNAPMIGTADHWGKFWNNGGFSSLRCIYPSLRCIYPSLRCIYPSLVKENQFNSTIDYKSTKSWLFKVAGFVRKYKIPLLINLLEKRDELQATKKHRISIGSKEAFNAKK